MEPDYSKREIDHIFEEIKKDLAILPKILEQTTKHNHRLTRAELKLEEVSNQSKENHNSLVVQDEEMKRVKNILLVVGCISGTVLLLKAPEVFSLIKLAL